MKSLKPIGRALKLGRSRAGRAVLNTSLGRITRVQIKENASKLVLNVHPNEPAEGKVVVEVKVPENVQYQPLLISTLEIEGTRGEAEAIILAVEKKADLLLLDERRGRTVAYQLGIKFIGLLGILIEAKHQQIISAVKPLLDELIAKAGFWVSTHLYNCVLKAAGE